MKKRVVLLIPIIILSCMVLPAISVEDIYQQVLEKSGTIAEISTSRYYSFIDNILSSLKGPSWNIALQGAEFTFTDNLNQQSYQLPGLDFSYSSPESDKKITFDARASLGSIRFDGENDFKAGPFEITLHGGVQKVYEFTSWDSTDYSSGWSETMNRITYENDILQFEIGFLNDILELLMLQREAIAPIMDGGAVTNRYYTGLNNGDFEEDSPEAIKLYTEMQMKSIAARQSLEGYFQKTNAIMEKYDLTLEDLMDIDSAGKYDLVLTPIEEGNYEVHSKYLEVMSLRQQIEEKTGTSSSLTLRAGLDPKISFQDQLQRTSNGISGEIGASFSTGNLSIDLSVSSGYDYSLETGTGTFNGPTISIGGSWSNTPQVLSNDEIARLKALYTSGTTFNRDAYETVLRDLSNNALRKEILEIEKLQDSLDEAIRQWNDAKSAYNSRCNELIQQIRDFNNEYEIFLVKYEGDIKLTEKMRQLLDEGKVSEAEYLEADTGRTQSFVDLLIYNVRSHILYDEIQMLQK